MKKIWLVMSIVLVVLLCTKVYAFKTVNVAVPLTYTTGRLCTTTDFNFSDKYRYKEKIPYCNRSVTYAEKKEIAKKYNVPESEWKNYEFDHFIPLSDGGNDSPANIWMQPLDQAHVKDRIEDQVYLGLREGTITRSQGVNDIVNWFCSPCIDLKGQDICTKRNIKIIGLNPTECTSFKDRITLNLYFNISSVPLNANEFAFTSTVGIFPSKINDYTIRENQSYSMLVYMADYNSLVLNPFKVKQAGLYISIPSKVPMQNRVVVLDGKDIVIVLTKGSNIKKITKEK
jgi:hypothetical protein